MKIVLDTAFVKLEAKTKPQLQVGSTVIEIEGSGVKIAASGAVNVSTCRGRRSTSTRGVSGAVAIR